MDVAQSTGRAARDSVCGMSVQPSTDTLSLQHYGHFYHFCSESCRSATSLL